MNDPNTGISDTVMPTYIIIGKKKFKRKMLVEPRSKGARNE